MATFEEFAQQLLRLKATLQDFYQNKIYGRRNVPIEWLRRFEASLGVIENILNELKNLAPDLSNFSEATVKRIKHRLEELEGNLKALTDSPAGRGLVVDISSLKDMVRELDKISSTIITHRKRQGAALRKYLTLRFILELLGDACER